MASPHIGCNEQELLYIDTPKLNMIVKGKPCHPKFESIGLKEHCSKISVLCCDEYKIDFPNNEEDGDKLLSQITVLKTIPLFFEYQNYELIIEKKEEADIVFWHDNKLIREKIGEVGKSKKILSGILNFGSEIGYSEIKILVDGENYIQLEIEIFPSKIDYFSDYVSIVNDVNNEIYNLAFDFLKKTYLWFNIRETTGNSLTEFFSIIKLIFDKLKTSVDIVFKTPHHVLQSENHIVPFHKVRKTYTSTIKWLEKNPEYLVRNENNFLYQKALTVKKYISYDTFENKFVKYILKTIIKKLTDIRTNYLNLGRKTDDYIINIIDTMLMETRRRMEFSFLRNVGELHTMNSFSLVLNMAPGYKEVYKYYLMLLKGLSFNGEVFKLSVKDLAALYEYWCFIKLNSLLKNKYKLIKQDLIKVDSSGLFVTLSRGKNSKVLYENPKNGEKFTISYNPPVFSLPTVSQRPDNILSLEKQRSKVRYEYIFDAKYRINPALEGTNYKKVYELPGPEEEDINTMHRYRDAIVQNASGRPDFERTMFGAYVLFPYTNERIYQEHRFYKSIEKVNVGGLPFLPSAVGLVEKFLADLIDDSPESAFERSILPIGTYDYVRDVNFNNRDVLVGTLSKPEQLRANLEHKFYHIPCSEISDKKMPLKYIALYQSSSKFKESCGIAYYGEIVSSEKVRRGDIDEVSTTRDSETLYYKFYVKEWNTLARTIKPKELRLRSRIYTNLFLLLNAECVPELCIKSESEYRLYMELKRLLVEFDVNIDNNEDSINSIQFEGGRVSIEDNLIKVIKNQNYREFSLESFKSKPRATINLIKGFLYKA